MSYEITKVMLKMYIFNFKSKTVCQQRTNCTSLLTYLFIQCYSQPALTEFQPAPAFRPSFSVHICIPAAVRDQQLPDNILHHFITLAYQCSFLPLLHQINSLACSPLSAHTQPWCSVSPWNFQLHPTPCSSPAPFTPYCTYYPSQRMPTEF